MEKNWRRKGVNILLLGFLMAVSILAVSCNSHDTQVTNSETQKETDKTENPSEFLEYKEVLTLYYEAPNRELLDTLYYSQYASDIRLGKEPTDSEELAKEKEAFQQLKEKLQELFGEDGISTYMESNTLLLKYQTIVDEIGAETKLDEVTFTPTEGAVEWKGKVTLSYEGKEQTFKVEGNLSLDEQGLVRYINSEGDGGLMDACKQIYQQQIEEKST